MDEYTYTRSGAKALNSVTTEVSASVPIKQVRTLRVRSTVFLWLLILSFSCEAADVVLIRNPGNATAEEADLELATRFYGLNIAAVTPGELRSDAALTRIVGSSSTQAVVITASALARTDPNELLAALVTRTGGSVPLLIVGVTPKTDGETLRAWSGGAVTACKRAEGLKRLRYYVARIQGLTGELSDLDLPIDQSEAVYFSTQANGTLHEVARIRADQQSFPVYLETTIGTQRVFLSSSGPLSEQVKNKEGAESLPTLFSRIAPLMMFVKSCAGERAWHPIHHYANLTIDDPWLREHYGFLDYRGLLTQMDSHNFHSTIAFVPWNYDRNAPGVVALLRGHPERFSISVHGDNHDHKEFTDYRSVPLAHQTAAVEQALARMARFQSLTALPYDKVMVFPHSIAPRQTLEVLRDDNFLATVNSSNVPMDADTPVDPAFTLRSVTLAYGGIPSIRRYSVEGRLPNSLVAIDAFLGNPLIFYCHQLYFASGINAFDGEADEVNRLQPDTLWRGLGEIVRHLYYMRERDDGDYDVLGFSDTIDLENPSPRNSVYYFRKEMAVQPASVTLDGKAWPYVFRHGTLEAQVPMPSGKSRALLLSYGNKLGSTSSDVGKTSLRVTVLRLVSDFRDVTLAQTALGRGVIRLYYGNWPIFVLVLLSAFATLVCAVAAAWHLRMRIRSRAATLCQTL